MYTHTHTQHTHIDTICFTNTAHERSVHRRRASQTLEYTMNHRPTMDDLVHRGIMQSQAHV